MILPGDAAMAWLAQAYEARGIEELMHGSLGIDWRIVVHFQFRFRLQHQAALAAPASDNLLP